MSEFESAKLKIAGNLQFSEATTGLITMAIKDKITQKQQREVASLMELGDSMEEEEEEEEDSIEMEKGMKSRSTVRTFT